MGICQEMELEVTFGVLGPILVEKPPPKVARARRRAETRDSFLEGSLHEQSGSSWSYLKMPMNSHYVGHHICTRIGQRKYAEARGSEKGKKVMYNYNHAVERKHELETRLLSGVVAAI